MGYKMKSSGLPFKELGSSPAKQSMKAERSELKRAKETGKPKSMSVSDFDETIGVTKQKQVRKSTPQEEQKKTKPTPPIPPTHREAIIAARKARKNRRKDARTDNKIARLNEPTRAEKNRSKMQIRKQELD